RGVARVWGQVPAPARVPVLARVSVRVPALFPARERLSSSPVLRLAAQVRFFVPAPALARVPVRARIRVRVRASVSVGFSPSVPVLFPVGVAVVWPVSVLPGSALALPPPAPVPVQSGCPYRSRRNRHCPAPT